MVVDPELHYCPCGYTFKFNNWNKIAMLFREDYTYTCPRCGTVMTFKLVNHVVKVNTTEIKNKGEVWKNG